MRVLVACEFSGIVRDAFTMEGHEAMSCDLLPSESPGDHYQGDVRDVLDDSWDLMVAHPPCTYLANSGVRWLYGGKGQTVDPVRWTGLWLRGLPPLVPTNIVDGREPRVHHASPGPDRWKERSRTYPGIAAAMAAQWGALHA